MTDDPARSDGIGQVADIRCSGDAADVFLVSDNITILIIVLSFVNFVAISAVVKDRSPDY